MRLSIFFVLISALAMVLGAPSSPGAAALPQLADEDSQAMRFVTVDVYVDPAGTPLVAWQARIEDASGAATLVGVEGGEDPSFQDAPTYDPAALRGGAVIVAAFDTQGAGPNSRTRVARLHFVVTADAETDFSVTAEVLASETGAIPGATIQLIP